MTKHVKIVLSGSRDIPFNQLVLSQANVRRVKAGVSIDALAVDIARRGLLQSLTVRVKRDADGNDTGLFEVPAGGRRFRALQQLVKQRRMAKTEPVPCIVREDEQISAEEDSLAENVHREALHPLDQFRAMQQLVTQGTDIETVAATFMTTPAVVKQRLRLASVSPKLHEVYADDGMTLEQLMAFSVSEDHERQEQVWDLLQSSYNKQPYFIRAKLTEDSVRATDKRVRFVALDAYVAAGGYVLRDLFEDDQGGFLQDVALLDRLVDEKLKAEGARIGEEGWKWIAVAVDFPYDYDDGMRVIDGDQPETTDEDSAKLASLREEAEALEEEWSGASEVPDEVDARVTAIDEEISAIVSRPLVYQPAEMARAGVFVSIDVDGSLHIERGFVRPDDEPAEEPMGDDGEGRSIEEGDDGSDIGEIGAGPIISVGGVPGTAAEPEDDDERDDMLRPLPDRLVTELTTHRTLALRDAVATSPQIAFAAVLHALVLDAFYTYAAENSCMQVSVRGAGLGLDALTRQQATFTRRDIAMFAHRHSNGQEQYDRVLAAMHSSDQVLALGRDGRGEERFTTVAMLNAEEALARNAAAIAASNHAVGRHDVERAVVGAAARGLVLAGEQRAALDHVAKASGLSLVVGYAGAGKSAMLGVAREAWEAAGYTVRGAALSGIAADNLEGGSGIGSRTIASFEHAWARDRDRLTARDVLVVDEAGMIGTRQLQRVLAEAAGAGAKVVMVGDVQQLQAIEAGAAFRLLAERHGAAEIGEVRRQAEQWMRDATRMFATGRTGDAIAAYTPEDETMHVAAIGTTGSGKSTALRAIIASASQRGDRQVVADPDGTAMSVFHQPSDIILNPFDARCAHWDLLGEIEQVGDFAMVAQSLLPHLGHGDHDQWISYAQQFLASAMESWVENAMGSSADFVAALTQANRAQLKALCDGTPAARYFEEGGERMLASILGTITPAVASLRSFGVQAGPGFSIRRWVREGEGSLWMPYAANQIAALRGLISCWMNLAIMETLSLAPSRERRIWFHVDELDALGRIEGLKDAQARLRKFGGRVAIGFQSFAQVKQIYGEGAHTIIENCGNLLLLRCGISEGGGTAELASDLIGNREVERYDVSRSRTRGRFTSRSMSMQSKRTVEDVALASEIMQLANREGFVKRATKPGWRRVRFPYVVYPERIKAFEPSSNLRVSHDS